MTADGMTAPLTALLERVEAATDRLDNGLLAEVICAARGWKLDSWRIACGDDGSDEFVLDADGRYAMYSQYRWCCPDASVDAALALVERALPGLGIVVCRIAGKPGLMQIREAFVFDECVDLEIEPDGWWRIRPAALAIVECLLRALHALASRDAAGPADAEGV